MAADRVKNVKQPYLFIFIQSEFYNPEQQSYMQNSVREYPDREQTGSVPAADRKESGYGN